MAKAFKDYLEVNEKLMEGFTVAKVNKGINAVDNGMLIELERQIDNVTIGIDIIYNLDHEEDETKFMISDEYVKVIS